MDPVRSILVPTDFRPLAQAALRRAADVARLDGSSIHLVHVLRFPLITTPYEVSVPGVVWQEIRAAAEREMESARKWLAEAGVSQVTGEIHESRDPVGVIEEAALAKRADFVVMGTHGRSGLSHVVLGSVAERTLRRLECPILVVKEEPSEAERPIERILLATDFSKDAIRAAPFAAKLASRLGARLDVLHAFDVLAETLVPVDARLERRIEEQAEALLAKLREDLEIPDVAVALHLERGRASELIPAKAEALGSQLIVMGRRGNSGLSHVLFGSVAERTLRAAPCSVLTVRAE